MTSLLRSSFTAFGFSVIVAAPGLMGQATTPAKPPKPAPATPRGATPGPAAPAPPQATKPAPAAQSRGKPPPVSVVPDQGKSPVTEVLVETRADGIAYLPGATGPFTGKAITASKSFQNCVESITPYRNGRFHGDVMTLYKFGNPKSVRTYVDGLPKKFVTYYQDGAKKFEQLLNAKDKAEGPYRRWFPGGQLQAQATYDDEERWHGENKEFSVDGKLKAHYIYDHGTIQKILFETPAAKAAREAPPKTPPPGK